jgi:molecular chaperone DnaJ
VTVKTNNLYEILGVSQTTPEKEIQKAFRKLAKTLHPDVNPAENAQDEFQRIQEAYEILMQSDLRKKYDEQLAKGDSDFFKHDASFDDLMNTFFGSKRQHHAVKNGEHIYLTISVSVEDILRGAHMTARLHKNRTCTSCSGEGRVTSKASCTGCEGRGGRIVTKRTPLGKIETFQNCNLCQGTGKKDTIPCQTCSESGVVIHDEEVQFNLKPQMNFGTMIVLKGKGHAGREGGISGNVNISLKQADHDKAQVDYEIDVTEHKHISLGEVLAEKQYTVIFPDGTTEDIKLVDQLKGNNHVVFPEKGMYDQNGRRGLYNLHFIVDYPDLTKGQRTQILNVLGRES